MWVQSGATPCDSMAALELNHRATTQLPDVTGEAASNKRSATLPVDAIPRQLDVAAPSTGVLARGTDGRVTRERASPMWLGVPGRSSGAWRTPRWRIRDAVGDDLGGCSFASRAGVFPTTPADIDRRLSGIFAR
jgi:hypothetical protein